MQPLIHRLVFQPLTVLPPLPRTQWDDDTLRLVLAKSNGVDQALDMILAVGTPEQFRAQQTGGQQQQGTPLSNNDAAVATQQRYYEQIQSDNERRRRQEQGQQQQQMQQLQSMYEAQQRQQQQQPQTQEMIMVTVPPNTSPGTMLNVTHNGSQYLASVPMGVPPGGAFYMKVPSIGTANANPLPRRQQQAPSPRGRGNPVTLPNNFLRPPKYSGQGRGANATGEIPPEGGMTDEQLAILLQDEMLLAELQRNPEFRDMDLRSIAAARPPPPQTTRSQTGATASASSSSSSSHRPSFLRRFSRAPRGPTPQGQGVAMPSSAINSAHQQAELARPDQASARLMSGGAAVEVPSQQGAQIEMASAEDEIAPQRRASGTTSKYNRLKAYVRSFNLRRGRQYDSVNSMDHEGFDEGMAGEVTMPWNDSGDGSAEMVTFNASSRALHTSDEPSSVSTTVAVSDEPEFPPTSTSPVMGELVRVPSGGGDEDSPVEGLTLFSSGGGVLHGDRNEGEAMAPPSGSVELLRAPSGEEANLTQPIATQVSF